MMTEEMLESIGKKTITIAGNQHRLYQAGYDKGKEEGGGSAEDYEKGVEDGKKAEYDAFWDELQGYGNRSSYSYAFWQAWWNDKNYNPKYPLVSNQAGNCFYLSKITDTKVDINFTDSVQVFRNSAIKTIRKIILSTKTSLVQWFDGCSNLENVTFEGTLETNQADFRWSTKLSKASIESVINALSTTTSGLSVTLSKTAVNNAFTTDEWTSLAGTKPNWTINLV